MNTTAARSGAQSVGWVEVTAKVAFENRTEYQGEGIVLYASDVKECEPLKEEMVYFN